MHASELVVEKALRDPSLQLWQTAWLRVARNEVARKIADRIDVRACSLSQDWDQLDDPSFLRGLPASSTDVHAACTEHILEISWPGLGTSGELTSQDFINDRLEDKRQTRQKRAVLRKRINMCASALIADPISASAFRGMVGHQLWREVGHYLAGDAFTANRDDPYEEEWLILNRLLLAEWFLGCRFDKACHVRRSIERLRNTILQVRGYLVHMPDYVSRDGIVDEQLKPSAFPGPFRLTMSSQSDIAEALNSESRNILNGNGFVYQILNNGIVGIRECAELYEYSVLAYMSLSCTEQLLRSRAEFLGVPHFKQTGVPNGVADWVDQLRFTNAIEQMITDIFDSKTTNIRNRIMHGGLLDHDAKWGETRAAMNGQSKSSWKGDPRLPKNVCLHCFECLEALDNELHSLGAVAKFDFTWSSRIVPSSDEIDFARQLECDLFREDSSSRAASGREWFEFLGAYTDAVMPSMKQHFQLGVVGWLSNHNATSVTRFFALTLIFEAAYRLTVHLLGFEILQKSRSSGRTKIRFQTRMLDSANGGICTDEIKDAIVAHARPEERDTAKQVLDIAIKTRNALAHGAFVKLDDKVIKGLGNVLFKSIQLLASCGYAHMVAESAYFRWQNERSENHGFDLPDWSIAQQDISKLIRSFV